MFHNSRKTIGVFLERSVSEFQNRLCQGIITGAKEIGYNVAVFSDYGNYGQNHRYFIGDQTLWELPPYEELDGVVLAFDTMEEIVSREHVIKNIRERCHCPIVSIRELLVGANNLLVDNSSCMEGLIDHFVKEHGMKKLCFMTGPKDHWDAQERLLCFKRKMDEYGLSYGEHQIFYGDFWKNKGKEACDWFLAEGEPQPEGIICANDYMASSVTQALQARGIKVPAQVLVSGYDNVVESRFSKPSVTTIRQPMRAMGRKAFEILERCWAGEKVEQDNYLKEEIVYRQSCGCGAEGGDENGQYATKLSAELDNVLYLETAASAMVTMLANAMDMNEYTDCLKQYVLRETGFKSFALCLAEHWEQKLPLPEKNYGTSMCKVDMVMGIHKSKVLKQERFPICQMVPSEFARDPDPLYVIPLHYLQQYMGYAVLQIDYDLVSNVNIKSWFIHLDSALENFRMKQRLHQVAQELESLYIQDTLTGLYNRRGLEKFGERMCEECIRNNGQFMIMEIDMDGLKQVNDRYGHEEGDVCITTIANAMMYAAKDGEICIRSGGDEYIVMGKNYSEEKTQNYIRLFREYIDSANASLNKPYTIGASLGYYMGVPDGKRTIENYLKIADDRMYDNKKMRKAKLHPGVEVR